MVELSTHPSVPPLAHDIFNFFKDKIIFDNYGGGNCPNRMKNDEKIKFMMRSFDKLYNRPYNLVKNSNIRFSKENQVLFFKRPEVQDHFL
jgi:hypothetical protein